MTGIDIRLLETAAELEATEELARIVWPGSEVDIVPAHMLQALSHNGGIALGAFDGDRMAGFVHGFLAFTSRPDRPRLKHHSHQLAVHPEYRSRGLGYRLKRAQWQMVRRQELKLITWTVDPLLSANAALNVAKLSVVCNTYLREVYGQMRDGLNIGLPSDRFQVDWWVGSPRVTRRLSPASRPRLSLEHFTSAGTPILNPTTPSTAGWPIPPGETPTLSGLPDLILVEIPVDFLALKASNPDLGLAWRFHTRTLFEGLFERGYLVTDFASLPAREPRSYYILSHGDVTLGG